MHNLNQPPNKSIKRTRLELVRELRQLPGETRRLLKETFDNLSNRSPCNPWQLTEQGKIYLEWQLSVQRMSLEGLDEDPIEYFQTQCEIATYEHLLEHGSITTRDMQEIMDGIERQTDMDCDECLDFLIWNLDRIKRLGFLLRERHHKRVNEDGIRTIFETQD